jgi:hypothetical protein
MQFTSGGSDGPRFDAEAHGLDPDLGNNVGGLLISAESAEHVAQALYGAGWRVRRSSWAEFEVENTYAELELYPSSGVRFRGIVAPERLDDLLSAFAALGLSCRVELDDGPETRPPS